MNDSTEHPGRLAADRLRERNMSVTEAAEILGVARNTLSRLINGRHGVSADMALRLERVFGGEPEFWMKLQTDFDLARARLGADQDTTGRRRTLVRKRRLGDPDLENEPESTSPSERLSMVWPVTLDAWAFKGESDAESRLQRHVVSLFKREGSVPIGWRVRSRSPRESQGDGRH